MLSVRRAVIATAAVALLCACGSKDSGGSSFSLGAKSPGDQLVEAYNGLTQGNLDPMVALVQLPDTTAAAREQVRVALMGLAQPFHEGKAQTTLVNQDVSGDIATVVIKIAFLGTNPADRGSVTDTVQMLRTGGVWHKTHEHPTPHP